MRAAENAIRVVMVILAPREVEDALGLNLEDSDSCPLVAEDTAIACQSDEAIGVNRHAIRLRYAQPSELGSIRESRRRGTARNATMWEWRSTRCEKNRSNQCDAKHHGMRLPVERLTLELELRGGQGEALAAVRPLAAPSAPANR
jgi:hypothetical protein